MKNTQVLRVVNSVARAPLRGNCQGGNQDEVDKENCEPLPKRPCHKSKKLSIVICTSINLKINNTCKLSYIIFFIIHTCTLFKMQYLFPLKITVFQTAKKC